MTSTDKTKQFLQEFKAKREAATPGEWETYRNIYIFSEDTMVADNNDDLAVIRARGVGGGMTEKQQKQNIDFVAFAANNSTKLIEACEVMLEALVDWCGCCDDIKCNNCEALEQVEQILEGK